MCEPDVPFACAAATLQRSRLLTRRTTPSAAAPSFLHGRQGPDLEACMRACAFSLLIASHTHVEPDSTAVGPGIVAIPSPRQQAVLALIVTRLAWHTRTRSRSSPAIDERWMRQAASQQTASNCRRFSTSSYQLLGNQAAARQSTSGAPCATTLLRMGACSTYCWAHMSSS